MIAKDKMVGLTIALLLVGGSSTTHAFEVKVSITNGGGMPMSPGVLYVRKGSQLSRVGMPPAGTFVNLCRAGAAEARLQEVSNEADSVIQTAGIQPAGTVEAAVTITDPYRQQIYFEAMYGKTKDTCAVFSVSSHSLVALNQRVTRMVNLRDQPVSTGAFEDPVSPSDGYFDCKGASTAVACLRELAKPSAQPAKIRFFRPYLPSVVNGIEVMYGAKEALDLDVPAAGALDVTVVRSH